MSTITTHHNTVASIPAHFQNGQVIDTNQSLDIGQKYANVYYGLGVTQIILGIISFALGATLLGYAVSPDGYYDAFGFLATGMWTGAFFCISGILGVVSGKKPRFCPIAAAMVMTITSVLAASTLVGMEICGVIGVNYYRYNYYDYPYQRLATDLHSILAVIGGIEFIIAIIHSAYCCAPTCCSTRQPQMMYAQQAPYGQILTSFPGQQITYVYPGQPNTIIQTNQQPATVYYQTAAFQQHDMRDDRKIPILATA